MSVERHAIESASRWWGEHIYRYKQALFYINPDDIILDIACGTGFGTAILADTSYGKVIGADIAPDAIDECRQHWEKSNLEFRVVDGTQSGFADHYFSKIVSFETIEHTVAYRQMIREFARVLEPGGQLILSTPNIDVSSPGGVINNPYHTQEFTYDELKQLLAESFPRVELFGQRYSRYDKKSLRHKTGKLFERLFLSFGIRKLPYPWRNGIMKSFFGYPLYPMESDFILETDISRIKKECPVLFAVCKKEE